MPRKTFKTATEPQESPAETYFTGEQPKEYKSRRTQFLIKPSTHAAIKKISVMRQTSVNDLVEQILSEYAAAHEDEIQRYEEVFGGDK